MELIKLIKKNA